MPGPPARLARVRSAGRAADGTPSQDRTVVLPNAVAVLDGASAPDPAERDGGWYAGQLAARLADTGLDLPTVLADSIAAVTSGHLLRPGRSPSSTVAMLRWAPDRVEGLVLGDSSLVVFSPGRRGRGARRRPARQGSRPRVAYHDRLTAGGGYDDGHRSLLRKLLAEQGRHRNSPGGYWIAEAEPAAARHALTRSWPAGALSTAVLATDGVTRGLGRAGLPTWSAVLELVDASGPGAVLDAVRAAEAADPDGRRWPRRKRHDDQALVVVAWRSSSPGPDRA